MVTNLISYLTTLTTDVYLNLLYIFTVYGLYMWLLVGFIHESTWQVQLFNLKLQNYKSENKNNIKSNTSSLQKGLLGGIINFTIISILL